MSERPPGVPSDIADAGLASAGLARIGWAQRSMPVLAGIGEVFVTEQPLAGLTVAACLHVTAETAVLVQTLRAGGCARSTWPPRTRCPPRTTSRPRWTPAARPWCSPGPGPTGWPTKSTSTGPWMPGPTWSWTTAAT